jgi:hypothetical protein
MTTPFIGALVSVQKNVDGYQVVNKGIDSSLYGFVQAYNANNPGSPYQFKCNEDYIRYRGSVLQRTPPPQPPSSDIVAFGSARANMDPTGSTALFFVGETGEGYKGVVAPNYAIGPDDAIAQIPIMGIDFNFFGINYGYGKNGGMTWDSNGALLFGTLPVDRTGDNWIDFPSNVVPAILMGNYDRRQNSFNVFPLKTVGNYKILKMLNFYQDYYYEDTPILPPNNEINGGQFQIRLVKEQVGLMRQFIEIRIYSRTENAGYSANYNTDPRLYALGHVVDPSKLCAWNITDGTTFLNPCGTFFTENANAPKSGSNFLFVSDSTGSTWQFINKAYLNI